MSPSHRTSLPLLLALLLAVPVVGGSVILRPAATQASTDEVSAFIAELGATAAADAIDTTGLAAVTAQQEDPDPDGDGLPSDVEATLKLDPMNPDTDGDGILDGDEDTDGDGLTNLEEVDQTRTNPARKDTDKDGRSDAKEDPDRDGLTNIFEVHRTGTDPRVADTDRDGIRDGAEDPDKDLLSNRGEQRFKTNPRKKDTDGDGRDDWHEDADHDGVPNGREQDAGPIPGSLRPKLSKAEYDFPPVHHRSCHSRGTHTEAVACTFAYGPKAGRKLVVVTGDSHAAHWVPALIRVAQHRGWKLMTITKSSCPVADVLIRPGDPQAVACWKWRRNAWARIQALKPDLVIASSLDSYAYQVNGHWSKNDSVWQAGLTRSLRKLGKGPTKVLMLGDVYPWGARGAVISCLRAHKSNVAACEKRRSASTAAFVRNRDRIGALAASAAHATFRSTRNILCPYDPCPLVVDRMLVTRDGGHISATYSKAIWRAIDRLIPDL